MSPIHLSAVAGPDGVLHLAVPVGAAGAFDVTVVARPKPPPRPDKPNPTPEELGWPPGYFETVFGSITDDSFQVPPRTPPRPIEPLDAE